VTILVAFDDEDLILSVCTKILCLGCYHDLGWGWRMSSDLKQKAKFRVASVAGRGHRGSAGQGSIPASAPGHSDF
jgi:hypothetical protein